MIMVESENSSELQSTAFVSSLHFTKMHALGNDFVMVSENQVASVVRAMGLELSGTFLSKLAKKICDRHFSVGADGLIIVRRGERPECQLSWTYINSDGSTSLMCGNGLRCLALWAHNNGWVESDTFVVETGVGPVEIQFESDAKISSKIGEPKFAAPLVPVDLSKGKVATAAEAKTKNKSESNAETKSQAKTGSESVIAKTFLIGDKTVQMTCLSMGNPHCVIFVKRLYELDEAESSALAATIQADPFFPQGVNVEFVEVVSRKHLKILVWERGCGKTLACASGAAAALVAGAIEGRCDRSARVDLSGGSLDISWSESDNHVRITGPAAMVFEGQIDLRQFHLEDKSW